LFWKEKKINHKLTLCQFPVIGAWVPEETLWIDVSKSCSATDAFYSIIFTLENLEFFPNPCSEKPKVYLCKVNEKVKWTCGPLSPSCGRHWNSMLKNLKDLTVGKFQWRVIETGILGIFWNLSYGRPWTILKTISEITSSCSSQLFHFFLIITSF